MFAPFVLITSRGAAPSSRRHEIRQPESRIDVDRLPADTCEVLTCRPLLVVDQGLELERLTARDAFNFKFPCIRVDIARTALQPTTG